MTIDPETLRQIEELSHDDRPLLVLDVDDVILEFIRPFPQYLTSNGYELRLDSFRLNGNIFETASGTALEGELVSQLIDRFFTAQDEWQTLVDGAADAVASIASYAEVVLLTAMPHKHRDTRRKHLDALGLPYPLLTTEMEKGPAIKRLRGDTDRPVAFVDDMPRNLVSARDALSDAHLIHLMADNSMRAMLPPLPDGIIVAHDWQDARATIDAALRG